MPVSAFLTDEVHHHQVQDHMGKDEVGETALRRNAGKYGLVLGISLQAEAHGQDEAADGADEPGEEGVEWEGAHQAAVNKLDDAGQQNVAQVDVHQLQLLGRVLHVVVVELGNDARQLHHVALLWVICPVI